MKHIRNFSIVAHIDHGKSTFSDRVIEMCNGIKIDDNNCQILDSMSLERERGITIKAQVVTLNYKNNENKIIQFNLIDTPGHTDFSYEVFRSISVCDGVILLIDAVKGIETQTVSNFYLAKRKNIALLLVINKIDLVNDVNSLKSDIVNSLKFDEKNIYCCSSKTGIGISNILESIIKKIPQPKGKITSTFNATVFDSWFDKYKGIILVLKINDGILKKNNVVKILGFDKPYIVSSLGKFVPQMVETKILECGEIGWISCLMKSTFVNLGDVLVLHKSNKQQIRKIHFHNKLTPKMYTSFFLTNPNHKTYSCFKSALRKLHLHDRSFVYERNNSSTLGVGFRCGFLGNLHMEIISERLKREFGVEIINTIPVVTYKILTLKNETIYVNDPNKFPGCDEIKFIEEPISECSIYSDKKYVKDIIELCTKRRGTQKNVLFFKNYTLIKYDIPTSEIIHDFYSALSAITRGSATFEHRFVNFKRSDIVKADILINSTKIDYLSFISHISSCCILGKTIINKLKPFIKRKYIDIKVQLKTDNKILTSINIEQKRKNVVRKCYGGRDISRKKKLLHKQKKGKAKLNKLRQTFKFSKKILSVL